MPQIDVREPGGASDSVHLHTLRIPVVTQRQVPTVHSFMFPVQFLVMVLDMPIEVPRQLLGSMVQKTVVPQLPSIEGRRHSFRAAEADPDGPDYSADHTDSAVAVLFVGRCPCCAGRADSQVPPWRRHSCSHSCSSLRKSVPVANNHRCIPVGTQRQIFMVHAVQQAIEIHQMLVDKVADFLVVQVVQVSRCRRGGDSRDLTVSTIEKIVAFLDL